MSTTASTTPGATNKKSFIPLEYSLPPLSAPLATANFLIRCNPELMTVLIRKLGVPSPLSFVDVYSLTDSELLAFVPRPVLALLLVFPVSESYENFRQHEDAAKPDHYTGHGAGEDPVWFKQTIRNACGLIGVLHAVANGEARAKIGMVLLRPLSGDPWLIGVCVCA
jgi:ubiquitin carboxyl-terminal hydrolase L3